MFKKILMASLAAGALALNAPVATAAEATGECGFDSVQQDSTTGQNYEGVAYGFASDTDGDPVSIRCYITVNDVPAAAGSTPTGTGTGVATTSGPISFEAAEGASVELCTEVNGVLQDCATSTNTQVPPQEVLDIINSVLELVDPTICPVIAALAGTYGPILINTQGDIYINGGGFYDCPPYDMV